MLEKRKIGLLGEQIAKKYLISKDYSIITCNYHVQGGEIDIIAKLGKKIIFVEVKTRTSSFFGFGEESFNWRKRQKIHQAILTYLSRQKAGKSWQADLIVVELSQKFNKAKVRHYQEVEL